GNVVSRRMQTQRVVVGSGVGQTAVVYGTDSSPLCSSSLSELLELGVLSPADLHEIGEVGIEGAVDSQSGGGDPIPARLAGGDPIPAVPQPMANMKSGGR